MSTIRVVFTLSLGYVQGNRREEREYDTDDLPDDPHERDKFLEEEWKDWSQPLIEGGWEIQP